MFRIADGREHFYQWDVDRQIIVEDNSITEVHFCNRTDDCSLVVDVVDGLANVPNVILQKSFDIRVFGFDGKATRYDEAFKVKARTKPTDYVYTEVEIKRYEDLSKRLDEIEEKGFSEEVVDNAVNDYFEKNPISFDGYATEAYVDNAISNIPEVDLSKHALKSEIPTKVSQLQNDSKFITREEVPQQDLSEYAKKSEIPDVSDFITSIPSEYITESELNAKGYATGGYVDSKIAGIAIPSLEGYATEKYVDDAIANLDIPEAEVDLSNYYTKEEHKTNYSEAKEVVYLDFLTISSGIPDEYKVVLDRLANGEQLTVYVKDFAVYAVADILASAEGVRFRTHYTDYVSNTATIITEYNFVCISGEWRLGSSTKTTNTFATKQYVDDAIANIDIPEGGDVDLTGYATEKYVDDAIAGIEIPEGASDVIYLDFSLVTSSWKSATAEEVEAFTRITSGEPVAVYVKDGATYSPADVLATSDATIIYFYIHRTYEYGEGTQTTKFIAQLYNGVWEKKKDSTTTYNYATKAYVDDAIANIDIPEGSDIDTSNFLTKTTVDDQYNWYVATTNKNQVFQNDVPLEKTDTALDNVVNGKTLNNNSIVVREGLQVRVPETPTANNHAASKSYVDTAIQSALSGIATAEGGSY